MKLIEKIGRYLVGEASPKDLDAIEYWETERPSNNFTKQVLVSLWKYEKKDEEIEVPCGFMERLRYRMKQEPKDPGINLQLKFWKMAASVLLLIALGASLGWLLKTRSYSGEVVVMTTKGQKSETILPDGTHVWLHSNSQLKYDLSNWTENRMVSCQGEVFFDVEHDSKYPFIVDAGENLVKVLGTKFNIRNYRDEDLFIATLTEGKVEVIQGATNGSIILKPGDQYVFNRKGGGVSIGQVDVNIIDEWRGEVLKFESVTFSELVKRLENYYHTEIVFSKKQFTNIHYTGTFEKLSLNQVLDIISMTEPIKYTMNRDKVKLEKIK